MITLDYGDAVLELRELTWPEEVEIAEAIVYAQMRQELSHFESCMALLFFIIDTLNPEAEFDVSATEAHLLLMRHYLPYFEALKND